MIKKKIYITLFTFLGLLLGFLVHAIVEVFYIKLILRDYDLYTAGLSWNTLLFIHGLWTVLTIGGGVWFGYSQGKYWWDQIYVKKQLGILMRRIKRKLK